VLHLIAPGSRLPKNVTYVGPITVQSIRCARKVSPDGRVAFDLIAEVSQTCTVQRGNESFEHEGGSTLVIDNYGGICYSIYKRPDSEKRQESQHRAMRGSVKRFWGRERGKYRVKSNVLQLLDEH
jgi:hypothetical protein